MITIGNTSIEINLIAVFVAILTLQLLPIVFVIWFAVRGFRVHWGWGVANLLLPVAIIPFCVLHPKGSKRPLILIGIWLIGLLILWAGARHGGSARPRVEVEPGLSVATSNAVLHLKLASFNEAARTGSEISGRLSRKAPVFPGGHANGRQDEERLMCIRADGFVVSFADRVDGEMRTNLVLFPYGQTTETNLGAWSIVGDYSGKVESRPNQWPEPAANGAFRLMSTNGVTAPAAGGGSNPGR